MLKEAFKFDLEINGQGIVDNSKYLIGEKFNWNEELKNKFFLNYRFKVIDKAKLRKNVIKVFKKLQNDGYKIIIITARSEKYYKDPYNYTYNWLKKYHVPFDKLIVNSLNKKEICLQENIDIFVDDMPSNCENVSSIKNIKVYMMDNVDNFSNSNKVIKVKDLDELYKKIVDEK